MKWRLNPPFHTSRPEDYSKLSYLSNSSGPTSTICSSKIVARDAIALKDAARLFSPLIRFVHAYIDKDKII